MKMAYIAALFIWNRASVDSVVLILLGILSLRYSSYLLPRLCRTTASLISSYLSLNCEGRWGTTDVFATSFLHFSLFSTALWAVSYTHLTLPTTAEV